MLTELPNRLAANERLHNEFVGMKRSDTAYAVLMIDIDHFKRVNDSHGHAVGDQVLQRIARVLRATLRESDFVARFGGEEFLALLPATELVAATRVAEKIRQAVEASPDPTAGPLTLSVGVATAHDEQASENEAVLEADRALYVAKDQGRNQVQLAPESLARAQADEATAANLVHLVWRDVYRSGNAVIDAPHRALMAQAGELSHLKALWCRYADFGGAVRVPGARCRGTSHAGRRPGVFCAPGVQTLKRSPEGMKKAGLRRLLNLKRL